MQAKKMLMFLSKNDKKERNERNRQKYQLRNQIKQNFLPEAEDLEAFLGPEQT